MRTDNEVRAKNDLLERRRAHVCPACLKPWIDDTGRFNACRYCPFRITPKPVSDSETGKNGGRP